MVFEVTHKRDFDKTPDDYDIYLHQPYQENKRFNTLKSLYNAKKQETINQRI